MTTIKDLQKEKEDLHKKTQSCIRCWKSKPLINFTNSGYLTGVRKACNQCRSLRKTLDNKKHPREMKIARLTVAFREYFNEVS